MISLPIFRGLLTILLFVFITFLTTSCSSSDSSKNPTVNNPRSGTTENFVIQCQTQCDNTAAKIIALGGTVNLRYTNVDALAISIPIDIIEKIQALNSVKGVAKDRIIRVPEPIDEEPVTLPRANQSIDLQGNDLTQFVTKLPTNYNFNNQLNGATQLHLINQTGNGVVVAIIDTGTANNADIVPSIAGSVIGGENFVMLDAEPSATSTLNDSHGTWVGGMVASHIALVVPNDDELVQSLLIHSPESVLPNDATTSLIPVIGTAPEASLYPLKVFPADGGGAPSSIVIQAMDRAITIKQNFNDGEPVTPVSGDGSEDNPFVYDSLNIQVVNMSLGGPTLIPGLDVEDILTRKMLMSGITVVTAAGNEGAGALTSSSPSTGVGSLSIGAASTPVHERVLRDLQNGLGVGVNYRPDNNTQVAIFSSRGPVPDGRSGVDLIANGFASFTQGADGNFSFVSGTSLSSPTVAGAAALLVGAVPDSKSEDVRNALMMSANATIVGSDAGKIDQGNGFLDIPAALEMLKTHVDTGIPDLPELGNRRPTRVKKNIKKQDLDVVDFDNGEFSAMVVDLLPGQVSHFFIPTRDRTKKLIVTLNEILPELPPDEQNTIFGDDVFLTIIDAPTTINDVLFEDFIATDKIIEIPFPQEGLVRVAVMGDWTNAGKISAKITIKEITRRLSRPVARGKLEDQEIDIFELEVDDDAKQIVFELFWKNNWDSFPAHDIDLYLMDPLNNIIVDGASFRSPERVVIDAPEPGIWTAVIEGFALHGFEDEYLLRATDDTGQRLELED
ncbi:MAG: S8 family serine peptidase [Gammaproteobacteria bacterium]|nr:S8 family serine peptidase [Gammaproteobacteria bacterium]